ncbi:hypothetical protein PG357_02735 [Riemerella anatipestifer]|nr:hypothetical protein [Riemerella anatipestifer]
MFILSCNKKQSDWNLAYFDDGISRKDSIKIMNALYDPKEFYEDSMSLNKNTSFVIYDNDYHENICKAEMINDTLRINFGYSTGFSSTGFNVQYIDKKYKIIPYYSSDNIAIFVDENGNEIQEKRSKYFFNNQKLILDKANYKKGDSIYGYINFSSLEVGENQKNINHSGKGYFRTKIQ